MILFGGSARDLSLLVTFFAVLNQQPWHSVEEPVFRILLYRTKSKAPNSATKNHITGMQIMESRKANGASSVKRILRREKKQEDPVR